LGGSVSTGKDIPVTGFGDEVARESKEGERGLPSGGGILKNWRVDRMENSKTLRRAESAFAWVETGGKVSVELVEREMKKNTGGIPKEDSPPKMTRRCPSHNNLDRYHSIAGNRENSISTGSVSTKN